MLFFRILTQYLFIKTLLPSRVLIEPILSVNPKGRNKMLGYFGWEEMIEGDFFSTPFNSYTHQKPNNTTIATRRLRQLTEDPKFHCQSYNTRVEVVIVYYDSQSVYRHFVFTFLSLSHSLSVFCYNRRWFLNTELNC